MKNINAIKKNAWPQNNQQCPIESKTYIVYLQYLLEITRYVIRKEVINSPVPSNDLIDLCGKTTCLYTLIGSVSDACDMLRKQVQYLRLLITEISKLQGSWGLDGAHMGPTGPRWAPCWPHKPCYQGTSRTNHRLRKPTLSLSQSASWYDVFQFVGLPSYEPWVMYIYSSLISALRWFIQTRHGQDPSGGNTSFTQFWGHNARCHQSGAWKNDHIWKT